MSTLVDEVAGNGGATAKEVDAGDGRTACNGTATEIVPLSGLRIGSDASDSIPRLAGDGSCGEFATDGDIEADLGGIGAGGPCRSGPCSGSVAGSQAVTVGLGSCEGYRLNGHAFGGGDYDVGVHVCPEFDAVCEVCPVEPGLAAAFGDTAVIDTELHSPGSENSTIEIHAYLIAGFRAPERGVEAFGLRPVEYGGNRFLCHGDGGGKDEACACNKISDRHNIYFPRYCFP